MTDAPGESITVNDSVLEPLVGSVTLNVPVPVYGAVPPEADTVQLNGFPAVWPVPQSTLAAKGGAGAVMTVRDVWLGWLLVITNPVPSRAEPVAPRLSATLRVTSNVPETP